MILSYYEKLIFFQIGGLVLLCLDIVNLFCFPQTKRVARIKRRRNSKSNEPTYDLYERIP